MVATIPMPGGQGIPSIVPPADVGYIVQASAGSGLPIPIVAWQVQDESAYNPKAVSPAGAEGPYQFLPSTYATYGKAGTSPFDWASSTQAYENYMSQLLRQEGGSVFKALEAYNAGPGNLQAGAGYATAILRQAGESQSATATPGSANVSTPDASTTGFSLNPLQPIIDAFGGSIQSMMMRLGLVLLGAALVILGLVMMNEKRLKAVVRTGVAVAK